MEVLGINIVWFFIPFGFFGVISVYCFYSMMTITAMEYRDDEKLLGLEGLDFLADFKCYTRGLKNEEKLKKHKRLYQGFVVSFVLMGMSFLILPVLSLLDIFFNLNSF